MDLHIDHTGEIMPLPTSSLPDVEHIELGSLNLESSQGASPRLSLKVPPFDRVKSWDSTTELANEFPSPSLDKRLVPPLCPDSPLCLWDHFESVTMLEYP